VSDLASILKGAERPVLDRRWMDDGNAFALLGRARSAQKRAGWTTAQSQAWEAEATAGDYDALLRAIIEWHSMPEEEA
jgi:hypothetical protein